MRRRVALIVALVLAALTAGIAIAAGSGGDGDERVSGPAAERAADAALAETGGGTVLEVERGDDDGAAYEVEVRKGDGTVVEVSLGADYQVLGSETDDDSGDAEDDSGNDDD